MDSAKKEILHYYHSMGYAPTTAHPNVDQSSKTSTLSSRLFKKPKLQFDSMKCQVEAYCSLDPVPEETDILAWWKDHSNFFPNLSKMAKDVLAISSSSVPSERANSEARELLPYTRNRLSPRMIEATLVAKSYIRNI
jgi:hypothetical protein